uniref:CUB domain-containing protein n=1 Tax=Strongyloides papillosus TaxID=174720 RepID=A0A0N5BDB1_STREA
MQYSILHNVSAHSGYDYSSIAHFANSYGSISNKPTFSLTWLSDRRVKLTGQEIRPTFLDLEWLYEAYCKNKFKPTVKCEKGFPKSDGSKKCECPTGYTGRSCKELQYYGDPKCPFQFKRARESSTKQQLNFNGNTKCTVEITAPEGKRIRIHVETINCTSNNPCFEDDCLQIKYRPSMTNTDLCLCGTLQNTSLWTLGNKALIQYRGKRRDDYAYMSFWSD